VTPPRKGHLWRRTRPWPRPGRARPNPGADPALRQVRHPAPPDDRDDIRPPGRRGFMKSRPRTRHRSNHADRREDQSMVLFRHAFMAPPRPTTGPPRPCCPSIWHFDEPPGLPQADWHPGRIRRLDDARPTWSRQSVNGWTAPSQMPQVQRFVPPQGTRPKTTRAQDDRPTSTDSPPGKTSVETAAQSHASE